MLPGYSPALCVIILKTIGNSNTYLYIEAYVNIEKVEEKYSMGTKTCYLCVGHLPWVDLVGHAATLRELVNEWTVDGKAWSTLLWIL